MDEVMYGVIFNANTDISSKDPPVIASKKFNASVPWLANQFAITSLFTPGRGSWEPILITTSITKV